MTPMPLFVMNDDFSIDEDGVTGLVHGPNECVIMLTQTHRRTRIMAIIKVLCIMHDAVLVSSLHNKIYQGGWQRLK